MGSESIPASCLPRTSDEETVVVQMAIPLFRGEQLNSLLVAPAHLTYTPLLKFAKFDSQYWASSSGAGKAYEEAGLPFPAPDILARLDEMEKRYLGIKDRKNIVESYHEIMKRTNPYEQKMEFLRRIENPPVAFPGEDLPSEPAPIPVFPWSGVEGVLSPRAKESPEHGSKKYQDIIANGAESTAPLVRTGPPNATTVVAKNALEMALQQLSIDGIQLNAASSEISRRIEEAAEHSELQRIAAAGLASPQVLEQLVIQSTLKREQERQRDELAVLKAWEKDGLASIERENNLLYMQRLFAIATGDDEAVIQLAQNNVIMSPEELRAKKESLKKQVLKEVVPKPRVGKTSKNGMTVHVVRGSNLPSNSECFVRIRVLNARGSVESEGQTSSVSDASWGEKIFLEFNSGGKLELLVFQYNSLGRDLLLGSASILTSQLKDTDGQTGVWILSPVGEWPQPVSLSLRFDIDQDLQPTNSVYKTGLPFTQNLMRERNMDFVADQVERVEEERRRLEGRIGDLGNLPFSAEAVFAGQAGSLFPGMMTGGMDQALGEVRMSARSLGGEKPEQTTTKASKMSGLKEVEKPIPSYEAVYTELIEMIKRGELASPQGRQLAYDFSYLGQSKLRDFGKDRWLLDYLSLQSDVLAQFAGDFPIQVSGLCSVSNMLIAVGDDPSKKRQISLVLWEASVRNLSLVDEDPLLGEQVLSSLALVVNPPRTSQELIDFALKMFERAREPVQLEQIVQVLTLCKSAYRLGEQVKLVLVVLERFRFSPVTVERSLVLLGQQYALKSVEGGNVSKGVSIGGAKTKSKSEPLMAQEIELVVVAAGMYADNPEIQVAAIDCLSAMAGTSPEIAERIENLTTPVVLDQSLDRNRKNEVVGLSVARLLLRLADLRPSSFDIPEAIPALFRIIGDSGSAETVLVALAAIRACFTSSNNPEQIYTISEQVGGLFVSSVEKLALTEASIAREACLTIEALIPNASLKEVLLKSGVVSIILKAITTHGTDYPKMVKQFMSALHSVILASPRAGYQLARLDGVQILMNAALYGNSSEWRALAILSDACSVDETKQQFKPDEDIERLVDLIQRSSRNGDFETAVQAIRLIGEIAFNSSYNMKDLFRKVHEPVNVLLGSGQVSFQLQVVIWALLNKRIPGQKLKERFEKILSPNGRDLVVGLSENVVRDYNLWVTSQGGNEAGASVANRKDITVGGGKTTGRANKEKSGGLFDAFGGLFGGGDVDELNE
jgi:hypothetical protein